MKKTKPLLYDPVIISRVKQYLEENVDKTYLDVGVMTKHLQNRYMEYSRRKLGPFRALVEQAYHVVSQSYGLGDTQLSGDDSDESSLEVMDERNTSMNYMSNMMNNLYHKTTSAGAKQSVGEAINISSDESEDGASFLKSNGKAPHVVMANAVSNKSNAATLIKLPINNEEPEQQQKVSQSFKITNVSNATTTPTPISNLDNNLLSVNPSLTISVGQKRSEQNNGGSGDGDSSMPTKKHKLEKSSDSVPLLQHSGRHVNQRDIEKNKNERQLNPMHLQQQRPKKYKKEVQLKKSRETFHNVGGMEKTLKELCELLMHIKSPDIYFVLGLLPPRGILLNGPSGCGKTLLAHAIAGQLNLALIEIPATELVAGVSGESEERIRDVFDQAAVYAPCVLFIDDIDAISSNRSMAQKDMERRIVSQLISSLDNLKLHEGGQSVLVIGATTRIDILDPALRRVGRFDHEISIGIPTRKDRKDILTIICEGLSVEAKCDFDKIAELTPGYVGADLLALASRAATIAVKRKCAEQMRAFQLKTQKNITIVDLDDDNDDNKEKNEKNEMNEKNGKKENDEKKKNNSKNEKDDNNGMKSNEVHQNEGNSINNKNDIVNGKNQKENHVKSIDTGGDLVATDIIITTKKDTDPDKKKDQRIKEIKNKSEEDNQQDVEMTDVAELDNGTDDTQSNKEKKNGEEKDKSNENETLAEAMLDANDMNDVKNCKVQEPTLFELLNWLDNPPEDITFVAEFCISFNDFLEAVKVVQPLAKREGFITVPDVTWDDVGSLQNIRDELKLAVLAPVKYPDELARLGITAPSGVLLCGPPGCGKTLLAKAIANEAGINFISVKGPELMNMYVGESERAVRACFQRARNSAPCVIFFDEFDSLCPKRDGNSGGDSSSGTRVVNQLLTEMDGVENREGVYILAATNRPDIIDPAILRPGRLDTVLYVGLPEQSDRVAILQATTKNRTRPILHDDVDFNEIAKYTDGYTGADLAGLVRQAAMLALKESLNEFSLVAKDLCVKKQHFQQAIKLLRPSVTDQDRKIYERLRLKYAASPSLKLDAEILAMT